MSEEVASGARTKERWSTKLLRSIMPKRKEKERWNSRLSFILASMGAAIGFGNVWRFPQLAYQYGGGAFFIPYLMALFFIGIPILVLEISLGQVYQMGDAGRCYCSLFILFFALSHVIGWGVDTYLLCFSSFLLSHNVGAFGSIHKRLTGIGVGSILCAYLLICYYVPLISWVANAFFDSFGSVFPWDGLTGSEASNYFQDEIIGMSTLDEPDLWPSRLIGKNVGYLFMSWSIVFMCVLFGVKAEGKIVFFTMGLPIILMFVFLVRACTLTGSSDGIKAYIGGKLSSSLLMLRGTSPFKI
jgi:solute carrier family 6 GABA transporter-like protein 1